MSDESSPAPARAYQMGARADAVAARRQKIIGAFIDLAMDNLTMDITLEEVAEQAGVSTRTIIRHFGDRGGLLDAVVEVGRGMVEAERRPVAGSASDWLTKLIDHYELRGDFVLSLLAHEDDPRVLSITSRGRELHREWVSHALSRWLPADAAQREAAVDLLVVASDVYTWKLLRRDRGLSRPIVETRMHDLIAAVLGASPFEEERGGS